MSARVSVQLSPDTGQVVAVKLATGAGETERMAAEAELLRCRPHPGLVRFVDYRPAENGAELHTRFVGPPLDHWHGTTEQIAGLVAALASTLDDLHRAGTAHGHIDRSHILLAADGRPVLCGLATAARGEASPHDDVRALGQLLTRLLHEGGGPRRPLRQLLEPTGSRRRLGLAATRATATAPERRPTARALAQQILDAVPEARLPEGRPDGSPGPEMPAEPDAPEETGEVDGVTGSLSDPSDIDNRLDDEAAFAAAFVDLSDTDENEIFTDRPWVETVYTDTPDDVPEEEDDAPGSAPAGSATEDTVGWEEAAVAAFDARPEHHRPRHRQPGTPRVDRRPGSRGTDKRRGRRQLAGAALALTAAVGVTGGVLAATTSSDAGTAPGLQNPVADSPTGDDGTPCPDGGAGAEAETETGTGPDPAEVVATYDVDVTGDGCVETVAVTSAGVVESGAGRWVVGGPDDEITLGDWDCDGTATPAVLRPSTGAVFVFPDWAELDTPVSIEPLTRTPEGRHVLTEPAEGATGCDTPVVELADGTRQVVEVRP